MNWHSTDIVDPNSESLCVLKGAYDALFVLKRHGNGNVGLQRFRGAGIEVFSVVFPAWDNMHHFVGSINKDNEMAFVMRSDNQTIIVVCVSQYGDIKWSQELTVDNWKSVDVVMGEDAVYVGAGFVGTMTIGNVAYTDDGVAMAFTKTSGALLWSEKVMMSVGAVSFGAINSIYFCGHVGDTVVVQMFELLGARLPVRTMELHDLMSVNSAVYGDTGLYLAGLCAYENEIHAFQVEFQCETDCFSAAHLTLVGSEDVTVELHRVSCATIMHLSIMDQGSWLLHDGKPVHHFGDLYDASTPRVAFCDPLCNLRRLQFYKVGSILGEFEIDECVFDIGREHQPVAYIMYIQTFEI